MPESLTPLFQRRGAIASAVFATFLFFVVPKALPAVELSVDGLTPYADHSGLVELMRYSVKEDGLTLFRADLGATDNRIGFFSLLGISYEDKTYSLGFASVNVPGFLETPSGLGIKSFSVSAEWMGLRFYLSPFGLSIGMVQFGSSTIAVLNNEIQGIQLEGGNVSVFHAGISWRDLSIDAYGLGASETGNWNNLFNFGALRLQGAAASLSVPFAGIFGFSLGGSLSLQGPGGLIGQIAGTDLEGSGTLAVSGLGAWLSLNWHNSVLELGIDLAGLAAWNAGSQVSYSVKQTSLAGWNGTSFDYTSTTISQLWRLDNNPAWILVLHPSIKLSLSSHMRLNISRWVPIGGIWSLIGEGATSLNISPKIVDLKSISAETLVFAGLQISIDLLTGDMDSESK